MADHHSEQEQLEELKRWWRENQNHVIAGLVLGVALVGGWRWWDFYQNERAEEGAALHAQVLVASQEGDMPKAEALLARLEADYARTPYAVQSAMLVAQSAVEAGQLDKARAALDWAHANGGDAELAVVVALRLARVQLAQGQGEAALGTLAALPAGKFSAAIEEQRGDVLLSLGRTDAARKAWSAALAAAAADADTTVLQMKLDDVGGAVAETAQ